MALFRNPLHSTILALCLLMLLPVISAAAADSATPAEKLKPGHELVQAFLQFYDHPDYQVRRQAYLLSGGLPPYAPLLKKLRQQRVRAPEGERGLIAFALAGMTREPEDIEDFLQSFPLKTCVYNKYFFAHGEWVWLMYPMQYFLRDLAYEERWRDRAAYRAWVLFLGPDNIHSAGPVNDPLLLAWRGGRPEEDFDLNFSRPCRQKKNGRESNAIDDGEPPDTLWKPMLRLAQSTDTATRVAARILLRYIDRFPHYDTEAEMTHSKRMPEGVTASPHEMLLMKMAPFPAAATESPEELLALAAFEQATYRKLDMRFLDGLLRAMTEACMETGRMCPKLEILRQRGQSQLNARQMQMLETALARRASASGEGAR